MLHLHIYKTSSCWAVFFWPTAFFDFCMTSESYPYHLKVAVSAFVCVLFSPPSLHRLLFMFVRSMFTSFILFCQLIISTLKVTHLKSGKTQCNFWTIHCFLLKKGLKYPVLLSVSGIRPSDWAPRHCCSESAVGKGEPPGGLTCQWTKCQTSCGLKCSFGGSVIYLSTRCVCVSGELRYK